MAGASLYTYFSSKQQLLSALAVRSIEWQEYEIRQQLRAGQDAAERLTALVEAHIRFTFAEPALVSLLLTETQELPSDVRESVERSQAESVDEWAGHYAGSTPPAIPQWRGSRCSALAWSSSTS